MIRYLIAFFICIIFVGSYASGIKGKIEPADVEDTVTKPVRDGVRQTIPLDLINDIKASYGYVDATLEMFGADPTGKRDSTAALNHVLEYARNNQMVAYLPSGIYKVTDTVECVQGYYRRSTGAVHQARLHPCVLVGGRSGSRPKIILQKKSKGFDDQKNPKPVIHFWTRAGLYKPGSTREQHDGALSMNQMLINVDVEVEEGNKGAIGVALYGAQGTGIEESRIDVRHGYIGIQGGSGSGGSIIDIEVVGGQYGLDYRQAQPVPVVVNARLRDQVVAAILYRGRQTLTLVGCEIVSSTGKPVILGPKKNMQPHWGQISIVDSVIEFGNSDGSVIDSNSSFTMNNVFIKGSRNISTSGLKVDKSLMSTNWIWLKQVAHGVSPRPREGYRYSMPIYIDYKKKKTPLIIALEYNQDPFLISGKHAFRRRVPDFVSKDVVNVKEKPYSAKGDGVADDTAAIQLAVLSGKNIFFPKGYYNITSTIDVPPGANLFGVARHLSIITTAGFKENKQSFPLLRVGTGASEGNMLAFLGLMPPKELPLLYALDWKASSESVVRDVNIFSKYLKGYSSPLIRKSADRAIPLVKVSGAGQWFNFFQEDPRKQADSYRHIKIEDSTEGLTFYGLNLEHARSECNGEIVDSRNIVIYGLKAEGNHTILCISDTEELFIYGFGGNSSAFSEKALLSFDNVHNYLLTNLVTHHRPVGKGSKHVFSGLMYDPATWVILQEKNSKKITWRPHSLERPVLVNNGIEY